MSEESYYARVESYFVAKRGSPLFITPGEWQLVWKWEQAGIPLHVVKEGIDRVFERPKTSQRPRKLGYCRQSVESAFRRFREASLGDTGAGADDDPFDRTERLLELVGELERLADTSARKPLAERSRAAAEELTRLAGSDDCGGLGDVEDRLSELENVLIDGAELAVGPERKRHLRNEAERPLVSYRNRMPEKVYAAALESAYRRRLRDFVGLPTLTLLDR